MVDSLEQQVESQLNAVDMEPGITYLNAAGKIRVKLKEKKDGVVWVLAYSDMHAEWRTVKVDETYKVKLPTKGEMKMVEATEAEVEEKKVKKTSDSIGKVRGLRMLRTWGQVYKDVGHLGLDAVIAAMDEEFPTKPESIRRWAPAYRTYYNTGRLPGVEKPENPIVWANPEIEAKKEAKRQAALAKLEAKEAERAARTAEKEAKLAAKREAAEATETAA